MRDAARIAYGMYAATAFVVVVLLACCPWLIVAPSLRLRRAIGRLTVRAWLLAIGVPLRVHGLAHLPAGACVVVCNHASYVDGIVLTSVLPERFTFLVQHRAGAWPYIGLILRRMGVCFVDRGDPRRAARATLGLLRAARRGGSLAIFPEGTFRKAPGLQPFYGGAFLIAARANLPVVPAVIRGSRALLEDGARWPAWSRLEVELLPAIGTRGGSRSEIAELRHHAYQTIGRNCGENVAHDAPSAPPLPA